MGKNIKGGNKHKGLKNSFSKDKKIDIPEPSEDDNSHIGLIIRELGDGRCDYVIVNIEGIGKTEYRAKARKNRQKGGRRIQKDKYILVSPRDFNEDERDILYTYKDDEIDFLVSKGLLKKAEEIKEGDGYIEFVDTAEDNQLNIENI